MANIGDISGDGRMFLRSSDHRFEGTEQEEYDSLKAAGRTYYDELRWFYAMSHDDAFRLAANKYGFKLHRLHTKEGLT